MLEPDEEKILNRLKSYGNETFTIPKLYKDLRAQKTKITRYMVRRWIYRFKDIGLVDVLSEKARWNATQYKATNKISTYDGSPGLVSHPKKMPITVKTGSESNLQKEQMEINEDTRTYFTLGYLLGIIVGLSDRSSLNKNEEMEIVSAINGIKDILAIIRAPTTLNAPIKQMERMFWQYFKTEEKRLIPISTIIDEMVILDECVRHQTSYYLLKGAAMRIYNGLLRFLSLHPNTKTLKSLQLGYLCTIVETKTRPGYASFKDGVSDLQMWFMEWRSILKHEQSATHIDNQICNILKMDWKEKSIMDKLALLHSECVKFIEILLGEYAHHVKSAFKSSGLVERELGE